MSKTRSFLKESDFRAEERARLFELAGRLKAERGSSSHQYLAGQTWALIFEKPSTRTRVSFEVGIHELGGRALYLDQKRLQMGRGETAEDTARVMARYVHGAVMRTYAHTTVEAFASIDEMPVINGLTDRFHPCQVYSDLFTMLEIWSPEALEVKALAGRRITFYGDCGSNMARSWMLGGSLFGMDLVLSGPSKYLALDEARQMCKEEGLEPNWRFEEDPVAAAEGADVVYTDVWVSMGDEAEQEQRRAAMAPYQVTKELMDRARSSAVFMHCLPAHVGDEVRAEVYESDRSIVFTQAENRLHTQKAIMAGLTGHLGD